MRPPIATRLPDSPRLVACVLLAVLAVGCASPLNPAFNPPPKLTRVEPTELETKAVNDLQTAALRKANGESEITQDRAFADILGQLQDIRAIDPAAEQQLIDDLKGVKPENYAMVVETFRTALAYRQQLAAREQAAFAGDSPVNEYDAATRLASHSTPVATPDAAAATHANPLTNANSPAAANWPPTPERPLVPRTQQQAVPTSNVSHAMATEPAPAANAASIPAPPPAIDPLRMAQALAGQSSAARGLAPPQANVRQLPEPPADNDAAFASDDDQQPAMAISAVSTPLTPPTSAAVVANLETPQPLAPLAAITAAEPAGDWNAQLHAAIADLETKVAAKPTTVGELHDHMRLRTLQLLAGNDKDAFRPIPGASPAQQDYWSKQLFAINAYLSATGKLDEKQRAIAALAPLDEARARLSELAALQVRNLTFVKSVDGFGAYEPNMVTSFQPGDKVVLYAEVENYASQASEQGYHTSLGTSFQVVDKSGHRVDGKQFPDIEDKCRNRRRDFHMQYELALPERIYPGAYELELTITDHHSGKIGQATLPFEIAADAPAATATAKK